jgi:GTP pyrophosphokinase
MQNRDEILSDIGLGRRLAAVVARQLMIAATSDSPGSTRGVAAQAAPVVIRGTEGMALVMAPCCTPIPGDAIVGHMRRDQGLAVHQADCANAIRARRADPERWLDMQWAEETTGSFSLNLDVHAVNERGVLGRVAAALAEAGSNIQNVHVDDDGSEVALIHFKVQVRDRQHLAHAMRTLRRIKQVSKVLRVRLRERGGDDI